MSGKISPNQIFMIFKNFEWIGMIRNECEGFKMIFRKIFFWSHKPKVALVISHESHPCPGSTVCLSRVIKGHSDTITYYSNAVISRHSINTIGGGFSVQWTPSRVFQILHICYHGLKTAIEGERESF